MKRKRILIVSASFFPKNSPRSFRTTELAKEFSRQGHDVVVCIPFTEYDYTEFISENPMRIDFFGPLQFKPISLKGKGMVLLFRRVLRRILGLLFEYPAIEITQKLSKFLRTQNGFDLLVSVAVPFPVHWAVAKARTKKHRIAMTWVADCGDPYMGNSADSFRKPFYFMFIEKWFSRKCDYLSIPFDGLRSKFYKEFHNKICIIPQGFRQEEIKLADRREQPIPSFAFAGSIIPGIRDMDQFLSFLSEINTDFKFWVYTNQHDYYEKYVTRLSGRMEVLGYLPRLELLYELSKCDFLLNIDTIYDCDAVNIAIPSKLIDYSFTKRPILNICSNSIDKKKILQFLSGNYENRRFVDSEDYRIERVSAKFLNLISENRV